jgi:hypothetical protein
MRIKKGQSVMETAVLVLVIVGALIAMQIYLKRGIQGRLRGGVDSIGEQYDPQATSSSFTINHTSNATTTTNTSTQEKYVDPNYRDLGGGAYTGSLVRGNVTTSDTRIETHYDNTIRNGYETVANP